MASKFIPEDKKLELKISADQRWKASDGSGVETMVEKEFTSPDDEGSSWVLYRVTRVTGKGILAGASYIQRVFTQGGLPPATTPRTSGKTARVAFTAEYILYREQAP
jgi:hypothetical protein